MKLFDFRKPTRPQPKSNYNDNQICELLALKFSMTQAESDHLNDYLKRMGKLLKEKSGLPDDKLALLMCEFEYAYLEDFRSEKAGNFSKTEL